MTEKVDTIARLKEIEETLHDANRLDRFDDRLRALPADMIDLLDELLVLDEGD
jgi:hypothetical protein